VFDAAQRVAESWAEIQEEQESVARL